MKIYKQIINDKDQEYISNIIIHSDWKYFHGSQDGDGNKFFYLDLMNDTFFSVYLFDKIQSIVPDKLELLRVYMNGHVACSGGKTHVDVESEDAKTMLIYCNDTWDMSFGGGTSFFNKNEYKVIYPLPRSGVYFNGNIEHCAQPVSRDFPGIRVTLAYKLRVIK